MPTTLTGNLTACNQGEATFWTGTGRGPTLIGEDPIGNCMKVLFSRGLGSNPTSHPEQNSFGGGESFKNLHFNQAGAFQHSILGPILLVCFKKFVSRGHSNFRPVSKVALKSLPPPPKKRLSKHALQLNNITSCHTNELRKPQKRRQKQKSRAHQAKVSDDVFRETDLVIFDDIVSQGYGSRAVPESADDFFRHRFKVNFGEYGEVLLNLRDGSWAFHDLQPLFEALLRTVAIFVVGRACKQGKFQSTRTLCSVEASSDGNTSTVLVN